MIRKVLLAMLFLLAAAGAFAQVSAGVLGGVNFNYYRGSDWEELVMNHPDAVNAIGIGYSAGVFGRYDLSETFGVRVEVRYGDVATRFRPEHEFYSTSHPVLDIPVVLSYRIPVGPVILSALLGPQMRISLGDMELESEDGSTESVEPAANMAFALSAGAVCEIPAGPGFVELAARYAFFLTGFWDNATLGEKSYLDSGLVTLGYGFRL